MTDQLISFETAKLAKQAGFPQTSRAYNLTGKTCHISVQARSILDTIDQYYPRETQTTVQRWLREQHDILVIPTIFDKGFLEKNKFCYQWYLYDKTDEPYVSIEEYKTWEEALEKGLKEALKLIK